MAYTVATLISKAWFLSGIVSRTLQTVSGDKISEGLDLLNALLSLKAADDQLIPYFTEYSTNAVIGQQMYFIPNLVYADTLTFNLQTVRFPIQKQTRKQYFNSLPFSGHLERTLGGSNLYLYFLPSDTYPIKIWGKFALAEVELEDDLTLTLDNYYIEYLRYSLAKAMCDEYNLVFTKQARLDAIENSITNISPPDLTTTKLSTFSNSSGINWAFVNLSGGWTP